jgi:hypothetical protein
MSILTPFEVSATEARLTGWELVEYLDIPIEKVLDAALENGWIDEDNIEDFLEFIGVSR